MQERDESIINAVAAGTANALVSAVDSVPVFDVSKDAVANFDDATPLDISTAAVAATTRSSFQTDSIILRVRLLIDWALRDTAGICLLQNVGW